MTPITHDQITELENSCGELMDNRFAVIAGDLIDMTSCVGHADESKDKVIVMRYDETDMFNASHTGKYAYDEDHFAEAYAFDVSEIDQAKALFMKWCEERLAKFDY